MKINAPVDQGIADLIQALSAFPRLRTVESCADMDGRGTAWLCFVYGEDNAWRSLADFVLGYLGPELMCLVGDRASVSIQVTTVGLPQGEITVRPGARPTTVKAIRRLSRNYRGRP